MKTAINLLKNWGPLALFFVALILSVFPVLGATIVTNAEGGAVEVGEGGASTSKTNQMSPSLLTNDLEQKVLKIRPMSTPLLQIVMGGDGHSGIRTDDENSQVGEFYAISTLPRLTTLKTAYTEPASGATVQNQKATLDTNNNAIFSIDDTIMVKGVMGFKADGLTADTKPLQLYVVGKDEMTGKLIVRAFNGKTLNSVTNCVPTITQGASFVRLGKAGTEKQIQTSEYNAQPTKFSAVKQKFMAQIEETTLNRIQNKEVDWEFSDMEQEAIFEMKLGMNGSYLFGSGGSAYSDKMKEEARACLGIFWQAGSTFELGSGGGTDTITEIQLIDLFKKSFTGNKGTGVKILMAGSDFIAQLEKVDYNRTIQNNEEVKIVGCNFRVMQSKFGKLLVVHDESFDLYGFAREGMIIDPDLIRRKRIGAIKPVALDLRKGGQKDVDATFLQDISCLCLQNPKAHLRVRLRD